MAFSVNHEEAAAVEMKPAGDYECVVCDARQTTTTKGTPVISIKLAIRTDVPNPATGILFHNLWMKKEPTAADNACEGYSAKQIQSLSKAAGLPNGKNYPSIEAWCADLLTKPVRATLEHEEYNGRTIERVKWVNETQFPKVADPAMQDFTELPDEAIGDVPF